MANKKEEKIPIGYWIVGGIVLLFFIFSMGLLLTPSESNKLNLKNCTNLLQNSSVSINCPKLDCSTCPVKTETKIETKYQTITKYQCSDGTVKDSLSYCPQPNSTETSTEDEPTLHTINKTVSKGNFSLTVTSVGFDNTGKYIINFTVKNRSSDSEYFQPSAIAIVDSKGNQYDVKHSFDYPVSTLSETILPGITKTGYWYFEDIPKSSTTGTFSFELGFMDKDVYKWTIPLN